GLRGWHVVPAGSWSGFRKSDNIEPEVTDDAICPLAIFSGERRLPACNRRQLADEILFPGSARVSRVGFGVSPKQSLEKFAMARRHRQHARRVCYPELPFPRVSLRA